jgi:adenylate cyclase
MSEVFISYARSTEAQARRIGEALRALGYGVWRDDELPAHRSYAEVIEERLKSAKAVVVVWSSEAVKSEWVRAEADAARNARTLVQLSTDGALPPMPFNQIQCADLRDWSGQADTPGWRKVTDSIAELIKAGGALSAPSAAPEVRKLSICVLPFANMSGDAEQEYFSDGISEDIITDLSKVSALFVIARNTAFTFKGKAVKVTEIATELNVSHVLEGSVRKAGARVRITAQLIDGATGGHVWAERYDRDLTDIFALQDEISEAIVKALKLRLLPEERKAIERRGTDSAEAYDLYLMARQRYLTGNFNVRQIEATVRLCERIVQIDPAYARAWALMANAQWTLRRRFNMPNVDGSAALERALALDPDLPEAHAAKAANLRADGQIEAAWEEARTALRLDPECAEAHNAAADLCFFQERFADAASYYEKAAALVETDTAAAALLLTCFTALGDGAGVNRAARLSLARAEAILAHDRDNGMAMGYGVLALAALGEADRTRDWMRRALLIDPENQAMRYNFACALSSQLRDTEAALDLLGPYLAQTSRFDVDWAKADPDLAALRDQPRFQSMIAEAETRLAAAD